MGSINVNTSKGATTINTNMVWDRIVNIEENIGILSDIATVVTSSNGVDDTVTIQNALNTSKTVKLVGIEYIVTELKLNPNNVLLTDGFHTVLRQKANTPSDKNVIVMNSGCYLDDIKIIGNISTGTLEFNHCIKIGDNTTMIENVSVGNVYLQDARGDGILIGAYGNSPENIKIGNVYVDNCYRNGISIISGKNITIGDVIAKNCGLYGVDIESEPTTGKVEGVTIGKVITSYLGIIGAEENLSEKINFDFVILKKEYAFSTPSYPFFDSQKDALTLRNANDVNIKGLDIDGYDRFAINVIKSGNDKYCGNIQIDSFIVKNCSLNEVTYPMYVNVAAIDTLTIRNIKATLQNDKYLVRGNDKNNGYANVTLSKVLQTGGSLASYCQLYVDGVNFSSTQGFCGSLSDLSVIKNSKVSCSDVVAYSDKVVIEQNRIAYTGSKLISSTVIERNNFYNSVWTV